MFAYDWNISEPPFMNYKCLVSAHEQIFSVVWLSLVHLSTFAKIDKKQNFIDRRRQKNISLPLKYFLHMPTKYFDKRVVNK